MNHLDSQSTKKSTTSTIAVVDYGHGNLGSIKNMLKKIGASCVIASQSSQLESAEKIILPGVGAFDSGMRALKEKGLLEGLLKKATKDNTYLLGVCLGMQMLGESSEEGELQGLGLIQGHCRKFPVKADSRLKVPRMGWSEVTPKPNALLFNEIDSPPRFYFVHSYYFECDNLSHVAATSKYGITYTAAIQSGNIFGVQFHPEKSHKFGMRLLRNFVEL